VSLLQNIVRFNEIKNRRRPASRNLNGVTSTRLTDNKIKYIKNIKYIKKMENKILSQFFPKKRLNKMKNRRPASHTLNGVTSA